MLLSEILGTNFLRLGLTLSQATNPQVMWPTDMSYPRTLWSLCDNLLRNSCVCVVYVYVYVYNIYHVMYASIYSPAIDTAEILNQCLSDNTILD